MDRQRGASQADEPRGMASGGLQGSASRGGTLCGRPMLRGVPLVEFEALLGVHGINAALYFDCLRIAVCFYSMEPSSDAVSSDRGVQARCVVNALHVHAAYAVSSRTDTRCARSMRCPRESGAMSSQGSIFFPRWVSVTRNHVAMNESV